MIKILIVLLCVTFAICTLFARSGRKYNLRFCLVHFFTMAIPCTYLVMSFVFKRTDIPVFIVPLSFVMGIIVYVLSNK